MYIVKKEQQNLYEFYYLLIANLLKSSLNIINIVEALPDGNESYVLCSIVKNLKIQNSFLRFYCVDDFSDEKLLCLKEQLKDLKYLYINNKPVTKYCEYFRQESIDLLVINSTQTNQISDFLINWFPLIRNNGFILVRRFDPVINVLITHGYLIRVLSIDFLFLSLYQKVRS